MPYFYINVVLLLYISVFCLSFILLILCRLRDCLCCLRWQINIGLFK